MIKQELDILKKIGFIGGFDTKKQVIDAALEDCRQSLQEAYTLIDNKLHHNKDKNKVLENINISLTILKLMKEGY
jgi:ribosomal protein S8